MTSTNKVEAVIAYSGAHPAHQQMLADLDTTRIMMLGDWSPKRKSSTKHKLKTYIATAIRLRKSPHEIVVIEGATPSALMAPIINCCSPHRKTIVALCGEDTLYRAFIEGKRLDRAMVRRGFRYVSKIIASGDLVARLAKQHLKPMPIEVRYPQISDKAVDLLLSIKPSLDSHNMLLIGSGSAYCKGADIASESLTLLRREFPAAQLTTIGRLDLTPYQHINVQGPVADIKPYLASSSTLIHPGRGEAFGVAIIEAMLAGVVPFVSEWTGAASFVKKVDPVLVVPLEAKEFASRITAFWDKDFGDREQISNKCREVAKKFIDDSSSQKSLKDFILSLHNPS